MTASDFGIVRSGATPPDGTVWMLVWRNTVLGKFKGKSALDVGAGNGNSAIFLLKRFGHVTAYESDERMFVILKERVRGFQNITPVLKRVASLDELLPDTAPQLIKLDVEGEELSILERSPQTLAEVRTLYVEIHGSAIGRKVKELLPWQYETISIGPDSEHYWLIATTIPAFLFLRTVLGIRNLLSKGKRLMSE